MPSVKTPAAGTWFGPAAGGLTLGNPAMGDRVIGPWQSIGDRAIARRLFAGPRRSSRPSAARQIAYALPWLDR
jgi:hypothetical protein